MSNTPACFLAVDDDEVQRRIQSARQRIVYAAPGLFEPVAKALISRFDDLGSLLMTVIIDLDSAVCRQGYGDAAGLKALLDAARAKQVPIRNQPGLRIGVLITDDDIVIFAPTARMVDWPSGDMSRPNAVQVSNDLIGALIQAVATDESDTLPSEAAIGRESVTPEQERATLEDLQKNPPISIDLARVAMVYTTKLQFVETELKGINWSERAVSIGGHDLNLDAAEDLRKSISSRINLYADMQDTAITVPRTVWDEDNVLQVAFNREGQPLEGKLTEKEIRTLWEEIKKLYLTRMEKYGWLLLKEKREAFETSVDSFREVITAWSAGFSKAAEQQSKALIDRAVDLISQRASRSADDDVSKQPRGYWANKVSAAMERSSSGREYKAAVDLVFKELGPDLARDNDFQAVLRMAYGNELCDGWYQEYRAVESRD